MTRIGFGYDVHPFSPARQLVLGGVQIPFERGLGGWSDADVLTHAIMDALLGAAALGDIGTHFPPGEPCYQDVCSLSLLGEVKAKLAEKGWGVGNIDATVIAEEPKLSGFIDDIRQHLAETLGIRKDQVSIKATTSERMGFVGRQEGIVAYAVALLEPQK